MLPFLHNIPPTLNITPLWWPLSYMGIARVACCGFYRHTPPPPYKHGTIPGRLMHTGRVGGGHTMYIGNIKQVLHVLILVLGDSCPTYYLSLPPPQLYAVGIVLISWFLFADFPQNFGQEIAEEEKSGKWFCRPKTCPWHDRVDHDLGSFVRPALPVFHLSAEESKL
jgi:hypothetical protein